jgi:hypothetical protein
VRTDFMEVFHRMLVGRRCVGQSHRKVFQVFPIGFSPIRKTDLSHAVCTRHPVAIQVLPPMLDIGAGALIVLTDPFP